jgi:hypothetical protein
MQKKSLLSLLLVFTLLLPASGRAGVESELLSRWGSGPYTDIGVGENLAVLSAGNAGLELLDLTEPSRPQPLAAFHLEGETRRITLFGQYLCVTGKPAGGQFIQNCFLQFVDISDPKTPQPVGPPLIIPGTSIGETVISGDYALSATYQSLKIFDISNPAAPTIIGSHDIRIGGDWLAVRDRLAFVVSLFKRFQVIDWSDPQNPVEIGSYESDQHLTDIVLYGDLAYLGCDNGLLILDLSDPTAPREVGRLDLGTTPVRLAPAGQPKRLLLSDEQHRLFCLTLDNPLQPQVLSTYDCAGTARGIATLAGNILLAEQRQGMEVINDDCDNPTQLAHYDHSGYLERLLRRGDYLFASTLDGIRILETAGETTEKDFLPTPGPPAGMALNGDYLYLTGKYRFGLKIAAVGEPGNWHFVNELPPPVLPPEEDGDEPENDIFDALLINGTYAYLSGVDSGNLYVYDLTDPINPKLLSTLPPETGQHGEIAELALSDSGRLLLAAAGSDGLSVIDIANPAAPRHLSHCNLGRGLHIATAGDYVYLSDDDNRVAVFSLFNPEKPLLVERFSPYTFQIQRLVRNHDLLFIASAYNLEVYHLGNRRKPDLAATLIPGWNVSDVLAAGNQIFNLATGSSGVLFSCRIEDLNPIDLTPPQPPSNLTITRRGFTGIHLRWQTGPDNPGGSGLGGCLVYRSDLGETPVAEITAPQQSWLDNNCEPGLSYTYTIKSFDNYGNINPLGVQVTGATLSLNSDRTPPAAPTGLSGRATAGAITLSWHQSFDFNGSGIAVYEIFRSSHGSMPTRQGETRATGWQDTEAAPGIEYTYFVRARDRVGRYSPASMIKVRTTTTPPSQHYYLTHFLQERPWETKLSFTNPTTVDLTPAPLYQAWGANGELEGRGKLELDDETGMPALSRLTNLSLPSPLPQTSAWLEITSDHSIPVCGLMGDGHYQQDFISPAQAATKLLFTHLDQAQAYAWTGITLVNPGEKPVAFTATTYDYNGRMIQRGKRISLVEHAKWVGLAEDLFTPAELSSEAVTITISADGELAGHEFFSAGTIEMAVLPGFPRPGETDRIGSYLYTILKPPLVESPGDFSFNLVNQAPIVNPVVIYWQDQAGLTLQEQSLELPVSGRMTLPLLTASTIAECARIEIVSAYPCATDLLLTPACGLNGGAAAPAQTGTSEQLVFTGLTVDKFPRQNWLTLANCTAGMENRVIIEFFQGDGELLLTRTLTLPPNGVMTRELRELAGSDYEHLRYRDLWLRVRGSGPLCGLLTYAANDRSVALLNAGVMY